MNTSQAAFPDLHELVHLFYPQVSDLARFCQVDSKSLPSPYQELLNHDQHMTVTVESFHDCLVDVEVLECRDEGETYQREILLRRQSDQAVVMYGIVRLHFRYLASQVQDEIRTEQIPLGRVLIDHNVLRRVELGKLWEVQPNTELQRHFNLDGPKVTFGRTAIIHCDDQPAIELVEIVAP